MVIGLSVYSTLKIDQSADGFSDYRSAARNSVLVMHLQANAFGTRMNFMRYLREATPENVERFMRRYNLLVEDLDKAKQQVTHPERLALIQKIEQDAVQYLKEFEAVQAQMAVRHRVVESVADRLGPQIDRNLVEIFRAAQTPEVVRALVELMRGTMQARLYGQRFLRDNRKETFDLVMAEFNAMEQQVVSLRRSMTDAQRIEMMRQTEGLINEYRQGMTDLSQAITQRNAHIATMNDIGRRLEAVSNEAVDSFIDEQNTLGPMIAKLNSDIIMMMTIISLIVVLIAIAVAIFIPRLIARGLSAIQSTLAQISQTGNFSIRADDKRTDEIGEMGKAVNGLLTDMQGAISEANKVVGALAQGQFDLRIQRQLVGDLDKLKQGINNSADNIVEVMGQLKSVMENLKAGRFDVKVNTKAQGEYKVMIDSAAGSMASMNEVINGINTVMAKVAAGEFHERVAVDAAGAMDDLKRAINQTVEVLEEVIGDITQVMDAQTQGDLTHSVRANCQGQLNQLKQSINGNAENLAKIIAGAVNSANVVHGAADEVSRGSQDLSQRVQEQAAALEETSATMDEMNSAVQNNTQNAVEATRVARDVQTKANQGTQVMQQTIDAMNAIQESSHKIADIVTLIDGIAFQTNLLALNAAVEAARAGDHGRGFAVVAGEVRALAQKSAEAAKDIKTLIDESVTRIDQGTKLASESGEVLADINNSVEHVTQMIDHIAQASREQAEGVNQVHKAIADIDQVTQQNAALVEETSAAAESMSEQATELSRNMAFFKTGQQGGRAMLAKPKAPAKPAGLPKPTKTTEKSAAKSAAKPTSKPAPDEWSEF
jgi:methyl-accepting chemotaxis protein